MKLLDVGSGDEIHFDPKDHEIIHIDVKPGSFCLELLCSGYQLPFPDDVFDIVHCSHVLEHLIDPFNFLKELKRVSRRTVVLKVPNAPYYKHFSQSKEHIFGWNQSNFKNLLKKHFRTVVVYGGFRIPEKGSKFKHKLQTIKVYAMSILLGSNELVGCCWI